MISDLDIQGGKPPLRGGTPPEWGSSGIQPSAIVLRLARPPSQGDPRLNREGGTDTTAGNTSDIGSADLSNMQTSIDTLNAQVASILSRLAAASATLAASCGPGGTITGSVTFSI